MCPQPSRETLGGQVTGVKRRACGRGLVYVALLNFTVLSQATWALPTPNAAQTSLLGVHGWLAEPIGKGSRMFFYARFVAHQG